MPSDPFGPRARAAAALLLGLPRLTTTRPRLPLFAAGWARILPINHPVVLPGCSGRATRVRYHTVGVRTRCSERLGADFNLQRAERALAPFFA
jgi:hypothetical protein